MLRNPKAKVYEPAITGSCWRMLRSLPQRWMSAFILQSTSTDMSAIPTHVILTAVLWCLWCLTFSAFTSWKTRVKSRMMLKRMAAIGGRMAR